MKTTPGPSKVIDWPIASCFWAFCSFTEKAIIVSILAVNCSPAPRTFSIGVFFAWMNVKGEWREQASRERQ